MHSCIFSGDMKLSSQYATQLKIDYVIARFWEQFPNVVHAQWSRYRDFDGASATYGVRRTREQNAAGKIKQLLVGTRYAVVTFLDADTRRLSELSIVSKRWTRDRTFFTNVTSVRTAPRLPILKARSPVHLTPCESIFTPSDLPHGVVWASINSWTHAVTWKINALWRHASKSDPDLVANNGTSK